MNPYQKRFGLQTRVFAPATLLPTRGSISLGRYPIEYEQRGIRRPSDLRDCARGLRVASREGGDGRRRRDTEGDRTRRFVRQRRGSAALPGNRRTDRERRGSGETRECRGQDPLLLRRMPGRLQG